MIHDDITDRVAAQRIVTILYVAAAETQITQYNIVRVDFRCLPAYTNAVARGGLAGNGYIRIGDCKKLFQRNDTGYAENYDTNSFCFDSFPEAAGSGVVEISHLENPAAAAPRRKSSSAFGAGECRNPRFFQDIRITSDNKRQHKAEHGDRKYETKASW